MSTRCIGCKREISKKQKDCYICGSSQNYLSYYSNNIIMLAIVVIVVGWISNRIIETKIESYQNSQLLENQESVKKFNKIRSKLNQQISILENTKNLSQIEIDELKNSIAQGSSNSSETLKTLEKEKARSKWLSNENHKFSFKIKELTNHIATLEKHNISLEKEKQSKPPTDISEIILDNQITTENIIEGTRMTTESSDNGI